MAGMAVPGYKQRQAMTGQRKTGEEMYNPLTQSTSYWSQDAGTSVDRNTLAGLESGAASADPANNRIVWNAPQTPAYTSGTPTRASSGASAPSGAASQPNNALMLSKLNELWNKPAERYNPVQVPLETGVNPADESYVAASKERIGNMLRSGMDFLDSDFTRRGFGTDSRIQAGAMQALTRAGMGEFAAGERQMVQDRQNRNRAITDSNAGMDMTSRRDNQQAGMQAQSRLANLLSFYGMLY
jgi:hypothetical protein